MSSPTTPATNRAIDNKKKEEVEDCRCSSEVVDAVSSVDGVSREQQKQQTPQLNVFENISKRQTKSFGGNLSADSDDKAADKKEQQLAYDAAEAGDSGFISGPQTNLFEDLEHEEDSGDSPELGAKLNIVAAPTSDQQNQPKQSKHEHEQEEENIILDSGCIDEDDFADEYDEDDECGGHKILTTASNEEKRKENEQLQQLQVENELSSVAVASTSSSNDPMILKQNVDAGMAEWFCNLSLQTDPTPRLQQQQQQQQAVAGISLNNLDSTVRRSATASAPITNLNSRRQQTAEDSASTPTPMSTSATTTLTPSNAWEQFYQQDDDGDTPLHLACISGYVDVVAALIRMAPHPCLFNIQNDYAQTPLHLAALTAQPKILRMLLIAGAEPIIRDRRGNTALHLACMSGEEQCVRALTIPISASEINEAHRQYGHRSNDKTVSYLSCARLPTDLEIWNYSGETCVHLAAEGGHIEVLRILLLYGADINARNGTFGHTPLHIAIGRSNEDLVNYLLDECQKLNLEAVSYAGLTAFQIACINNKQQMQTILKKRGADPLTPPDSDYDSDSETELEDAKCCDHVDYGGGNLTKVA